MVPEGNTSMVRIPSAILMLAFIVFGLSACDAVAPSLGISADIDAAMWGGPTSLHPGGTLDRRDEPEGSVPWAR
jgi:hypothetical protein